MPNFAVPLKYLQKFDYPRYQSCFITSVRFSIFLTITYTLQDTKTHTHTNFLTKRKLLSIEKHVNEVFIKKNFNTSKITAQSSFNLQLMTIRLSSCYRKKDTERYGPKFICQHLINPFDKSFVHYGKSVQKNCACPIYCF